MEARVIVMISVCLCAATAAASAIGEGTKKNNDMHIHHIVSVRRERRGRASESG